MLLKSVDSESPLTRIRQGASIIVFLCVPANPPLNREILLVLLSTLAKLVHHEDTGVLIHTIGALMCLTTGGIEYIQLVVNSEVSY